MMPPKQPPKKQKKNAESQEEEQDQGCWRIRREGPSRAILGQWGPRAGHRQGHDNEDQALAVPDDSPIQQADWAPQAKANETPMRCPSCCCCCCCCFQHCCCRWGGHHRPRRRHDCHFHLHPPSPSVSPTHTEARPSDSDEDEDSAGGRLPPSPRCLT